MKRVVRRTPPRIQRAPAPVKAAPSLPLAPLRVERGTNWVFAGSVKIGKYIPERRTIQIKDKCRGRAERRGTDLVEVSVDEFSALEVKRCEAELEAPIDNQS